MPAALTLDDLLDRSNLTGRQFLIYAGQRLHPGEVLYNSVYANRWPGLDPLRFQIAWQSLVSSCDALRTVVEEIDGVPQQHVLPVFDARVESVDLRADADPEAAALEWIRVRLLRPIDLAERIYDTALLRVSDQAFVWFLHIHHIVVDGGGVQILLRRLSELYEDPGRHLPAPPQFAEFARRSCEQRGSDSYRAARDFWLNALREVPETPHFYGVDGFRSTAQERVVVSLDRETGAALVALARKLTTAKMSEHAALANLFNAVFAAYLARICGSDRISIGVTFHNRNSEDDRRTIGLFMEVFPIVLTVGPQDSLLSLVQQVATLTARALQHRTYSVGHSARAPAFSGLFNYMRALTRPVGRLEARRFHPGQGSNAVSLSVEPRNDSFDLWFDVSADVAGTSSATQVAGHLHTLLCAAVGQPGEPLRALPLLGAEELRRWTSACTGPDLALRGPAGCHKRFEHHAAVRPDAEALVSGTTVLSYSELNRRANQLARELKANGARRGTRVGICLERSPEMIVALLGVLKSGAAYVPLDPTYPRARLHQMLVDADPVVLITAKAVAGVLPPYAARPLYVEHTSGVEGSSQDLTVEVGSDDIAYVIYTSGSTGTPKGVMVTHGNVTNHLAWRESFFPLTASDRCLQTASLSFDDSVWEILEPLSAGACVVLTRPRFEYDSAYLVALMQEKAVSVACFVPSLLRGVIDEPAIVHCSSLRRLTTGGEGLSLALQRSVREKLPAVAFYNGYGTTETTIASLYWRCIEVPGQTSVPIGRPIANTQVYVLDSLQNPVPPGVLGELCIGGAGVARGYLNRADLTSERFVRDKLGPGNTLYRTGDLGRIRADGVFEFAGRLDNQVKIRGVRVELGDIEAAVLDHPRVRAAAVVCNETATGTRLTAYVVPRGAEALCVADLRAFVRDRIPAALVPNRFEMLQELPLTPNGKIDRRALPCSTGPDDEIVFLAPRTPLEARLLHLWEAALEARPIGVRHDLFALGGHSLSAVRLAAAIGRSLERTVSPGLLFECPTIEALAARLGTPVRARGALVPLSAGAPGAPLYLVHHISGDVTAYRDLAPHLGSRRPVIGIRMPELDSHESPPERIEVLAARYVREIRERQPQGPYLLGGHSAGAHIAFEMAQQLHSAGCEVALLAILEADARRPGGRGMADTLRYHFERIREVPASQRASFIWRKLSAWRARSGIAQDSGTADPDGVKNVVWTAMENAVRSYRPRAYPGAITLFRATDRRVTGTYGRTLGWGRLARGGVRVIDVPGSHSTVLRPGSEPPMATPLRACLDELPA